LKHILDFLESFVIVILVLTGLVGLSYRMFRGGGWFESALERAAEIVFQNVTVSIVVAIGVTIPLVIWHERRAAKGVHGKRLPTIILFALLAAGVFFVGHYAIRGTL